MVRLKMGNLGLRSPRGVSGDGAAARRPILNGSPRRKDGPAVVNGGGRRAHVDESGTISDESVEETSNGSHESLGKLGGWNILLLLIIPR